MSNNTKDTDNQVDVNGDGSFYVLWRGKIVYDGAGVIRKFESEANARAFLVTCDKAGKPVE
jgi:hypothetical protein